MKAYIVKYALTKGIIEAEYDPEDSVKSSTYVPVIWAKFGQNLMDGIIMTFFLKMNMHLLSNVPSSWLMKCANAK